MGNSYREDWSSFDKGNAKTNQSLDSYREDWDAFDKGGSSNSEEPSLLGIPRGIKSGLQQGVGVIGGAMQTVSPEGSAVSDAGKSLTDYAEANVVPAEEEGFLEKGAKMLGLIAPFALAQFIPGANAAIDLPLIGSVSAGAAAGAGIFGLSQAHETKKAMESQGIDPGMVPVATGAVTAATLGFLPMIFARTFSPAIAKLVGANVAKQTVGEVMRPSAAMILKDYAIKAAETQGLFAGQTLGVSGIEKMYGVPHDIAQEMWASAESGLALSVFGAAGMPVRRMVDNAHLKTLADPWKPADIDKIPEEKRVEVLQKYAETRAGYVEAIKSAIENSGDVETAKKWEAYAYDKIKNNKEIKTDIALDQISLDSEMLQNKVAREMGLDKELETDDSAVKESDVVVVDEVAKTVKEETVIPAEETPLSNLEDLASVEAQPAANVDPLIEEAKKYKTAEEFVKAQEKEMISTALQKAVDYGKNPPKGIAKEGKYYHVVPKDYAGGDIISGKELGDKFNNKWGDTFDYAKTPDYKNVSLFDNVGQALEYNKSFLNGEGKILEINTQKSLRRNSEGYAVSKNIPQDWIRKEVDTKADLTSIWNKAQEGKGKPAANVEGKQPWEMTRKEYESKRTELPFYHVGRDVNSLKNPWLSISPGGGYPRQSEALYSIDPKKLDASKIIDKKNGHWQYDGEITPDMFSKVKLSEGQDIYSMHKAEVSAALSEGKPVPESVLKDYPDLAKGNKAQEGKAVKPPESSVKPKEAQATAQGENVAQGKESVEKVAKTEPDERVKARMALDEIESRKPLTVKQLVKETKGKATAQQIAEQKLKLADWKKEYDPAKKAFDDIESGKPQLNEEQKKVADEEEAGLKALKTPIDRDVIEEIVTKNPDMAATDVVKEAMKAPKQTVGEKKGITEIKNKEQAIKTAKEKATVETKTDTRIARQQELQSIMDKADTEPRYKDTNKLINDIEDVIRTKKVGEKKEQIVANKNLLKSIDEYRKIQDEGGDETVAGKNVLQAVAEYLKPKEMVPSGRLFGEKTITLGGVKVKLDDLFKKDEHGKPVSFKETSPKGWYEVTYEDGSVVTTKTPLSIKEAENKPLPPEEFQAVNKKIDSGDITPDEKISVAEKINVEEKRAKEEGMKIDEFCK
jgi:hypothetical protein